MVVLQDRQANVYVSEMASDTVMNWVLRDSTSFFKGLVNEKFNNSGSNTTCHRDFSLIFYEENTHYDSTWSHQVSAKRHQKRLTKK